MEVKTAAVAARKKRETNALTVTADDEITVSGKLVNLKGKHAVVLDLLITHDKL